MRSRLLPILTLLALAALPAAAHSRTLSEPNSSLQPELSGKLDLDLEIAFPAIVTDAPDTLPVFTRSQKLASGFFGLVAQPNFQGTLDLGRESRQGDDYMHARYYNPNLGRFLSVDPEGIDPKVPQSWNRYSYVWNNPIKLTDPTGRYVVVRGADEEERQRNFDALKLALANKAAAERLRISKVGNEYRVVVLGGMDSFRSSGGTADVLGRAIDASARIGFQLTGTDKKGMGGAWTDRTAGSTDSEIFMNPNALVATAGGVPQTTSTAIMHEFGHALGIATIPEQELNLRYLVGAGTNSEALGAENAARRWYLQKARERLGAGDPRLQLLEEFYRDRTSH